MIGTILIYYPSSVTGTFWTLEASKPWREGGEPRRSMIADSDTPRDMHVLVRSSYRDLRPPLLSGLSLQTCWFNSLTWTSVCGTSTRRTLLLWCELSFTSELIPLRLSFVPSREMSVLPNEVTERSSSVATTH